MKYVIAAVYDSKAKAYLPPVFCSNAQVALRAFVGAANTPDHQIGQNAEDFSMFIIGSFDDDTADIVMFPERINLGIAASFLKVDHVQHEIASQSVGHEAHVQSGAKGGNSSKQLRQESRAQDDV